MRSITKYMVICIDTDDNVHRAKIYSNFDAAMESFKARLGEIVLDLVHDGSLDVYDGVSIIENVTDFYSDPIYFVDKCGTRVQKLPENDKDFKENFDGYIEISSKFELIALEIVEEVA